MKKHGMTALAMALVFLLAACQLQNQPATPNGGQGDPLPSHVQGADDPTLDTLSASPASPDAGPADLPPADEQATDPKLITMDEAIAIALKDAGFAEKDVTGLHAELERDDGVIYYDVDFYKDAKEYDYEIHAESGKILEPVSKPASTPSSGSSSTGSSTASTNITKDTAISKALEHAGLKKSQVSRLRADLDRDDGRTVYEVEFETADFEYEYEINAKTGKVIHAEKERND